MERKNWWRQYGLEIIAIPIGVSLILGLWSVIVVLGDYPDFILPSPWDVYLEMVTAIKSGVLWTHTQATLLEMSGGLALGLGLAMILGYILAKNPLLERLLGPYIVASQSVPAVAIAPLLIIWFGSGKLSKVFICALVVFFPVLVNIVVGIRSVDPGLRALMRSLNANRLQTFIKLEIPAAMPVILGGLKIGVILSVIGAVVGEFVGADRGLGYLINLSKGMYNTALMFTSFITLTAISLILYLAIIGLEKWLLAWRDPR